MAGQNVLVVVVESTQLAPSTGNSLEVPAIVEPAVEGNSSVVGSHDLSVVSVRSIPDLGCYTAGWIVFLCDTAVLADMDRSSRSPVEALHI